MEFQTHAQKREKPMETLGAPFAINDPSPPRLIPFTRQGATDPEVFACGGCGLIWGGPDAEKIATWHCAKRICGCGKVLGTNGRTAYTACGSCREESRFAKAEKVSGETYAGPVCNGDDRYWSTVEDALDELIGDDEMTAYLWACREMPLALDADRVLDWVVDDHHDEIELEDADGLRQFIANWNARQAGVTWFPDFTKAVVLGPVEGLE